MAYHNTICKEMLSLFSRLDFEKSVQNYNGDKRIRKLNCYSQFVHLFMAQLAGRESLRDTVDSSQTLDKKLYHLGCQPVKRSTLSDANNKRDHRIYEELFFNMYERVQRLAPKYKLDLPNELYIMDSTTIDLCLKLYPWAQFRKNKAGIKLHTLLKSSGSLPEFIYMTEAKTNDTKGARQIPVPEDCYLAIDKGYHDFDRYNEYNNKNIRFVTRMKTNAAYQVVESLTIGHPSVLADEIIEFTGHNTRKKYPHRLRKITWYDSQRKKKLIFLTNDLQSEAAGIADIYKARWEIELFFKTIKQNLKIKRFFGHSENAVRTQIWIAMIVYLIIGYLKFSQKTRHSIQQIFRIIQFNLFERKSLIDLVCGISSKNIKSGQIALFQT